MKTEETSKIEDSVEAFCPCCNELIDVPCTKWELGEAVIECPNCGVRIHFTVEGYPSKSEWGKRE
jgi:transcription elongation factor Elf1